MAKKYEINDHDIESVLRYLKYYDPENATSEKAISLLEDLQQGLHGMAHHNPELLDKLQKMLDQEKFQKPGDAEA
jgi:hypothetical protein